MWATKKWIRTVSVLPVLVIFGLFVFEWYVYNVVFTLSNLAGGVWKGKMLAFALTRAAGFNALWLLAVWSFLTCSLSDPGFVPKDWRSMTVEWDLQVGTSCRGWNPGTATMCDKCDEKRPERAHHCAVCGRCVLRMDHHCPWIGNCVGIRNHKAFILMTGYGMFACLTFVATAIPWFKVKFLGSRSGVYPLSGLGGAMPRDSIMLFSLGAMLAASFLVALGILWASHMVLLGVNRTSIELGYPEENPYSLGCLQNFKQLLGELDVSWFLPVVPTRPHTDGLYYPQTAPAYPPPGRPEASAENRNILSKVIGRNSGEE